MSSNLFYTELAPLRSIVDAALHLLVMTGFYTFFGRKTLAVMKKSGIISEVQMKKRRERVVQHSAGLCGKGK